MSRRKPHPAPPDEPQRIRPWRPPFESTPWPPNKPRIQRVQIFHGPPLIPATATTHQPLLAVQEMVTVKSVPSSPVSLRPPTASDTERENTATVSPPRGENTAENVTRENSKSETASGEHPTGAQLLEAEMKDFQEHFKLKRPTKKRKSWMQKHKHKPVLITQKGADHAIVKYQGIEYKMKFVD